MGNSCQVFNSTEDKLKTVLKKDLMDLRKKTVSLNSAKKRNDSFSNNLPPIPRPSKDVSILPKIEADSSIFSDISETINEKDQLKQMVSRLETKSEIGDQKSNKKRLSNYFSTFKLSKNDENLQKDESMTVEFVTCDFPSIRSTDNIQIKSDKKMHLGKFEVATFIKKQTVVSKRFSLL